MSSRYSIVFVRKNQTEQFEKFSYIPDSPEFDDKEWDFFQQENGEVIYLAEQDNVGFFHYEHWDNAGLIRRLKYNDDGSWIAVEGEPETWEKELVFSPENFEKIVKCNDQERREEISEYWQRKRIQVEEFFPILVGPIDFIKIINDFWALPKDFDCE